MFFVLWRMKLHGLSLWNETWFYVEVFGVYFFSFVCFYPVMVIQSLGEWF